MSAALHELLSEALPNLTAENYRVTSAPNWDSRLPMVGGRANSGQITTSNMLIRMPWRAAIMELQCFSFGGKWPLPDSQASLRALNVNLQRTYHHSQNSYTLPGSATSNPGRRWASSSWVT